MTERVILTFDVEEFDIPCEYGQPVPPDVQLEVGSRGLEAVRALLERCGITATLFTTAHFAQHQAQTIRYLASRHEIASHGFWHSRFAPADLAASRAVLRQISGQEVIGFRMARMAPVDTTAIAAAGYLYNSSENPIWLPGRYNNWGKPRRPYLVGDLVNIPVSASPGWRVPLFWLGVKNFPMGLIRREAGRTLAHDGAVNFYFHPWEFTDLSAYRLPWYVRRHSGQGMMDRVESLVHWLRRRAEFVTFATYLQTIRPELQPQR